MNIVIQQIIKWALNVSELSSLVLLYDKKSYIVQELILILLVYHAGTSCKNTPSYIDEEQVVVRELEKVKRFLIPNTFRLQNFYIDIIMRLISK